MPFAPLQKMRSLSIGQLTFGSFMLLLAMIAMTSVGSVVAIRHVGTTFAELQRLDSLGDLSEEIDRRMSELRLAARDIVSDPSASSGRVSEAAAALTALLKTTRLKLAPEQQSMIDGVTQRLVNYRDGIDQVTALMKRRADLVAGLPPTRERFETAVSDVPARAVARNLFRSQNQVTEALLTHDPEATERATQQMRAVAIDDAATHAAVDAYTDAVTAISSADRQIADIDRDVLGTEGQQIGRVTDLLRDLSMRQGRVLSSDLARTLADEKWQSIILGLLGVVVGVAAALFVVRRTVRPLNAIARAIRLLAGGKKDASIPSTDVDNEIGDIARAAEVFRQTLVDAETSLRHLRETQNSLIEAEKLAALGRLVAGVAHEVNNPVGISLTVASSLERKSGLFAAEVARGDLRRSSLNEFLETTRDASSQLVANLNRAAELIQSFKQVAADRNYSDQRSFDLGELTEQVLTSLRPGLRKHPLTLNVDCQPKLAMNSYPGSYGQVLTNLVLNAAVHAFPDGREGAIDIQVKGSGPDNVEIVFSDNGCGMTAETKRRAFDPFFTTRRDQGGTGLGLHIVYNIVTNRLGGRLHLDSEPGKGTRIQIVLPRHAPLEQPAE